MRTARSAAATWAASASSSVCTAMPVRPSSARVRRIRIAISPRLAIRTLSIICTSWSVRPVRVIRASHPEDAVAGLGQGGAGDDVQGQAQHGAGVGGVDDPVVPEPGGGVVGAALGLVLLDDGALELGLLGLAPGAAAGLDPVASPGREDGGGLLPAHDGHARV